MGRVAKGETNIFVKVGLKSYTDSNLDVLNEQISPWFVTYLYNSLNFGPIGCVCKWHIWSTYFTFQRHIVAVCGSILVRFFQLICLQMIWPITVTFIYLTSVGPLLTLALYDRVACLNHSDEGIHLRKAE